MEEVVDNPSSVKMLNAIKISGRNKNGLGIGVFNAITEKTVARIKKTSFSYDTNNQKIDSTITYRNRTTEPFANYNIIVLDQQFNQNSSVSVINTNVTREGSFRDANATALLMSLTAKMTERPAAMSFLKRRLCLTKSKAFVMSIRHAYTSVPFLKK